MYICSLVIRSTVPYGRCLMSRQLPPLYALRAFEAAARLSSFTRAGEELSITQSAISRHIRTLEEHFACRLFVRSGRSLQLTEAGRVLLPVEFLTDVQIMLSRNLIHLCSFIKI